MTNNIISFVFLKMSKKKSWAVQFKEFRVFAECVLDYLRSQVVLIFYVTGCDHSVITDHLHIALVTFFNAHASDLSGPVDIS